MLSYAEHGKFPATTQGRKPSRARRKGLSRTDPARLPAMVRKTQWTTGTKWAQWSIAPPAAAASGDVEGDRLGDGLAGILSLQVIFAARYARTRNLGRTA